MNKKSLVLWIMACVFFLSGAGMSFVTLFIGEIPLWFSILKVIWRVFAVIIISCFIFYKIHRNHN